MPSTTSDSSDVLQLIVKMASEHAAGRHRLATPPVFTARLETDGTEKRPRLYARGTTRRGHTVERSALIPNRGAQGVLETTEHLLRVLDTDAQFVDARKRHQELKESLEDMAHQGIDPASPGHVEKLLKEAEEVLEEIISVQAHVVTREQIDALRQIRQDCEAVTEELSATPAPSPSPLPSSRGPRP